MDAGALRRTARLSRGNDSSPSRGRSDVPCHRVLLQDREAVINQSLGLQYSCRGHTDGSPPASAGPAAGEQRGDPTMRIGVLTIAHSPVGRDSFAPYRQWLDYAQEAERLGFWS